MNAPSLVQNWFSPCVRAAAGGIPGRLGNDPRRSEREAAGAAPEEMGDSPAPLTGGADAPRSNAASAEAPRRRVDA